MITQARFAAASRLLHWLMAPMIITMLFIGIGMAASVSRRYDLMVSIHRPLGFAILVLCLARIVNRFIHWEGPPIHCDHCGREIASEYGDPDPA